jgi:predicted anti-sigma-YlaC factor YlaD
MSDSCRDYRAALGAAVLGDTDPAEHVALQAHLDGCADCRAELRELTAVANALPLADPERLELRPEPARDLGARVLDRVARERKHKRARRRQRVLVAIAAVLMVVIAGAAFVVFRPESPAGTRVTFPVTKGVSADATLRSKAAGTEVALNVAGLPKGYYWLWLSSADGERVGAGTFRGTDAATEVVATAALPLAKTHRIWVTDKDDKVVLDQFLAPSPT